MRLLLLSIQRILALLRTALRSLFRRRQMEVDLTEELRLHLELETEQKVREGLTPAAARRAALLAFGGVERTKEECRDARGVRVFEDLVGDVRYAARGLARSPGFSAVAILTLVLGIGANSALFGLLNALLLRPPTGVPAAAELLRVGNGGASSGLFSRVSYPDYRELAAGSSAAIELAGALETVDIVVGLSGEPLRARAQLVSGNYFSVIGVRPAQGRGFLPADDSPGGVPVVMLGHGLWEREFGGDPGIVGQVILVNGHGFTVVGIAPAGFVGLEIEKPAELWVPIATQPLAMPRQYDPLTDRRMPNVQMVGRLRAGVTAGLAEAALSVSAAQVETNAPERFRPLLLSLSPLRGWVPLNDLSGTLPVIVFAWILTGVVLLIASANVANLMLARAVVRRREIGIRLALGAGRARLIRLLVAESLTLSLTAGVLGLLASFWVANWFQARFRGPLAPLEITPDLRMLSFTLGLAVATGLVFGLIPAWRASRPTLVPALKGNDVLGLRRSRLQGALVVAQVALSLTLLVAGGLFLRGLQTASEAELGFETEGLLVASFDLTSLGYTPTARGIFFGELRERIMRLPGVNSATVPAFVPLIGPVARVGISLSGSEEGDAEESAYQGGTGAGFPERGGLAAFQVAIGQDYFSTLGIPLLRGRGIEARDLETEARTAVISESFARRYFAGEDPLGRHFRRGSRPDDPLVEVVGVAGEIAFSGIGEPPQPHFYVPFTQGFLIPEMSVAISTTGDPTAMVGALREVVRGLDPNLPLFNVQTLAQVVDGQLGVQREIAGLIAGVGTLALLLAALGLYGVIAFTVAGRTQEIGVRMALGASASQVTRLFVRTGARLASIGLAVGAFFALALGRLIASIVTVVDAVDPLAFLGVGGLLAAVTLLASYLPARRAAGVNPMIALRRE